MNFNPLFFKKQKGQTLIEALVALGAAVLVLSAISVVVVSALNNAQSTKNQNLATQYAQQGIEIMRQNSQSDWSTFSGYSNDSTNISRYCLAQNKTTLCNPNLSGDCAITGSSICNQNYGIFGREVDISKGSTSNCSDGNIAVSVNVSWSDSKCTDSNNPYCHEVKLNSCLSNHNSNIVAP